MIKKKILIIASSSNSLINFRGDLIKDLIKNNFEIYTAAPDYSTEIQEELIEIGAVPIPFSLQGTGLNPFADIKSIIELKHIIKDYKINLVFPYTIKPVVYGSIAANSLNVPVISLITGLGYTFSGQSIKSKLLQKFSEFLYRLALKRNKFVFFQNNDDYNLFISKNIILKNQQYGIVSGSGVNLNEYKFRKNINNGDKVVFVFVARLIREKGIHLFIDAAKILKSKYPNTEFHILGAIYKDSPSAIEGEILEIETKNGNIIHHGSQKNVQNYLNSSDVFVLPSFYREGVPRSILEALSIGMPIITTDAPGCRETVKKGENGFLIETKNLDALVNSMEYFIKNPEMIHKMGIKSRTYAEERFDVKIINEKLVSKIKNII